MTKIAHRGKLSQGQITRLGGLIAFVCGRKPYYKIMKDLYDNEFLIGLLYIFYLYKLLPPAPLNNTSPTEPDENSEILIDRIFKEIRMIQDKLAQYDSQMKTQAESS